MKPFTLFGLSGAPLRVCLLLLLPLLLLLLPTHYYHYYYYYCYYCYYYDTTSNNDDAFSVVSVTTFCTIETTLAPILTPMCVLTFDVHLCITMYVLRALYPHFDCFFYFFHVRARVYIYIYVYVCVPLCLSTCVALSY